MRRVGEGLARDTRLAIISFLKESGWPVHTLTWANRTGFAEYEQVAQSLKASFYFVHPYHAWERGANEHTQSILSTQFGAF